MLLLTGIVVSAGFGTPNDSMQSMHATPQHAPALDSSNPAVIWKAIDVSMVSSLPSLPWFNSGPCRVWVNVADRSLGLRLPQ